MNKEQLINEFVTLLRDAIPLASNGSRAENDIYRLSFVRPDEQIHFNQENAERYMSCLNQLSDEPSLKKKVSRGYIDSLMMDMLFRALHAYNEMKDDEFQVELKVIRRDFKASLDATPKTWRIAMIVDGFDMEAVPELHFGNIRFCRTVNWLQSIEKDNQSFFETFTNKFENATLAEANVVAVDKDAALYVAEQEIRTTVDVMNFYSNLLLHSDYRARISLSGEAARNTLKHTVLLEDTHLGITSPSEISNLVGPIMNLSASMFNTLAAEGWGITKASNYLAANRTKVQDSLIASMRWVGRANIEDQIEEAFLLYAIGLEALLSPASKEENTYTLSLRAAYLLGTDFESRKNIAVRLRRLYNIRSGIVHRGKTDVAESDLSELRAIVRNCILRLIPFCDQIEDIDEHFERLILSGSSHKTM